MKWQRCAPSTPGHAVSTTKAVICRRSFPPANLDGVRAITTISSALVPLVHHSFSPFRIQDFPSSLGTAVVSIAAGSDPTPGSVSANAEIAPFARRGKRSEEHTSELQSPCNIVCRLLLEKKKTL